MTNSASTTQQRRLSECVAAAIIVGRTRVKCGGSDGRRSSDPLKKTTTDSKANRGRVDRDLTNPLSEAH